MNKQITGNKNNCTLNSSIMMYQGYLERSNIKFIEKDVKMYWVILNTQRIPVFARPDARILSQFSNKFGSTTLFSNYVDQESCFTDTVCLVQ